MMSPAIGHLPRQVSAHRDNLILGDRVVENLEICERDVPKLWSDRKGAATCYAKADLLKRQSLGELSRRHHPLLQTAPQTPAKPR